MKKFMAIGFCFLAAGIIHGADFGEEMKYFDGAEQGTGYYKPRRRLALQKAQLEEDRSSYRLEDERLKDLESLYPIDYVKSEDMVPPVKGFMPSVKSAVNRLMGRPEHIMDADEYEKISLHVLRHNQAIRQSIDSLRDAQIKKLQEREKQLKEIERNMSRGVSIPGSLYTSYERPFQIERRGTFANVLDKLRNASARARSWVASQWYK